MPHYLTPKQDDFDKIPELQVCIAEALCIRLSLGLWDPSNFNVSERQRDGQVTLSDCSFYFYEYR